MTPSHSCQARADGGAIDVVTASSTLSAVLTGTVAANAHLGSTGSACETFHLMQEFEITCSDPAVKTVSLTLDSSLVGFVRSRHKAGAQMKIASAVVAPIDWDGSPVSASHPIQAVEGTQAQLCNQHLVPITVPSMPLGRYVLQGRVRHRRRCGWSVRRPFRGRLLTVHRPARRLGAHPRSVPGSRQEEFRLLFEPDSRRSTPNGAAKSAASTRPSSSGSNVIKASAASSASKSGHLIPPYPRRCEGIRPGDATCDQLQV